MKSPLPADAAAAAVLHPETPFHWVPARPELRLPLVLDSPHSWPHWPEGQQTAASNRQLMTGCDAFVDELWGGVADQGGALLAAHFHRAYIDANRSANDLDPEIIDGVWPGGLEQSDMCRRGMGLIRRYALPNVPMYSRPLTVAEVMGRLERYYWPYRTSLGQVIDLAQQRFGAVWHINCHSMKSVGNAMNTDAGKPRPDMVVSNAVGGESTSSEEFIRWVAERLGARGYKVNINTPYPGGNIVKAYGAPRSGRESIQIELNRALYMDEAAFAKHAGFSSLQGHLNQFMEELADYIRGRISA